MATTPTVPSYHALSDDEDSNLMTEHEVDDRVHFDNDERRYSQLQKRTAKYRQWLYILSTLYITTVVFGLLAFRAQLGLQANPEVKNSPLYPYLPEIPTKTIVFEPDYRFWTSIPDQVGRGFVNLTTKDAQYFVPGSPAPKSDETVETYGVALFHQLHCLGSIRAALAAINSTSMAANPEYRNSVDVGHLGHCFDYIRQSLMCSGDMSLESYPHLNKENNVAIDGWGAAHTCRDWDTMYNFMVEKKFSDRTGIL
ncbi:hypothetical protein PVAG01_07460 [Phlyctema vagabunda]|uniref:Oxidase ustYa n=1 Tax=Phlyctema vagabunda TaxID=108571 RepID=A0ABR4PCH9_9HELO